MLLVLGPSKPESGKPKKGKLMIFSKKKKNEKSVDAVNHWTNPTISRCLVIPAMPANQRAQSGWTEKRRPKKKKKGREQGIHLPPFSQTATKRGVTYHTKKGQSKKEKPKNSTRSSSLVLLMLFGHLFFWVIRSQNRDILIFGKIYTEIEDSDQKSTFRENKKNWICPSTHTHL